ncbi:hypothetical protein [Rhizobium sp. MHM7A]|uniref:hypothetical protein n=1 Tax=Rhizobium sp. MHM7A TaxID=2583233 RepID=UPI001106460A|nr:hypothetical protein [Rhizobium sp. MHM7A]TLX16979.1 hypothetical protein FFR93_06575 [Rhizobium sp. MHM7A]
MAADLIIDEASAELQIVSSNPLLKPTALIVVGQEGLFEIYARLPNTDHVFLGRLADQIADSLDTLKSARWTSVDKISAIETYGITLMIFDVSLVRSYFLSELQLEWDVYCNQRQLDNETGAMGIEILRNSVSRMPIDATVSIFPDHRNINLFTIDKEFDGLLNEVARQPAGGLAGLRSMQEMDTFLKSLSLRQ